MKEVGLILAVALSLVLPPLQIDALPSSHPTAAPAYFHLDLSSTSYYLRRQALCATQTSNTVSTRWLVFSYKAHMKMIRLGKEEYGLH